MRSISAAAAKRAAWEAEKAAKRETLQRFPELLLRVWASPQGVHLMAEVRHPGRGPEDRWETIRKALWQPSAVTELSVVEWGERALRSWLEEQMLTTLEGQLKPEA